MVRLYDRIRIGIVGLGWIGQEIARAAFEDARVSLVGVVDSDPTKAGRDLGEIIGEGRLGVPIDADVGAMLSRARPEVAVICSTSSVEALSPTLELCIEHGAHVVTTCENMADPDSALSQLRPGIEERARAADVVILATGVNPGFAMDRLPVTLSQATRNIRRIRVVRVVDASTRRAQLQAKIGVGMTPQAFGDAIRNGTVGHAGLGSSLRLVSKGLGISLDKTTEALSPLLADTATTSTLGAVPAGRVRGIYQIARGYRTRREIITLELTMALDEPEPRDTIDIVGEPPIHFEGELPGDDCTVATVLSAVSVVVTMSPGLRTVLDVPLERPEEPERDTTSSAGSAAAIVLERSGTQIPKKADAVTDAVSFRRSRSATLTEEPPTVAPLTAAPLTDGDGDGDARTKRPGRAEVVSRKRRPAKEAKTSKEAKKKPGKASVRAKTKADARSKRLSPDARGSGRPGGHAGAGAGAGAGPSAGADAKPSNRRTASSTKRVRRKPRAGD
ncbi:MAG: hypothetical protein IPK13_26585 [Deltaproteobacteria bacterium]|nr:hypothetical protein [Deltaproteobacteria bacterium]